MEIVTSWILKKGLQDPYREQSVEYTQYTVFFFSEKHVEI